MFGLAENLKLVGNHWKYMKKGVIKSQSTQEIERKKKERNSHSTHFQPFFISFYLIFSFFFGGGGAVSRKFIIFVSGAQRK